MDIIALLVSRKKAVLWTTGVTTSLAIILAFVLPKMYTAKCVALAPTETQSSMAMMLGQLAPVAGLSAKELGVTTADKFLMMLKSESIANAMVRRFGLMQLYKAELTEDAKKELAMRSELSSTKEGFLLASVTDRDAQRAAAMANAYIEELQSLTNRLSATEASQRRRFFEKQVELSKAAMTDAEEQLKKTQEQTGTFSIDGQTRATIAEASALKAQIAAKQVQLQSMGTFATDENPGVIMARQELRTLQTQLTGVEKEQDGDGGIAIPTRKLPAAAIQYIRAFREVKYQEATLELLSRQYELARIDEVKSSPLFEVIDLAVPPERKSSPKRALLIAIGLLAGLLGASGFLIARVGLREYLHRPENRAAYEFMLGNL